MSVLFFMVFGALAVTVEEALERRLERVAMARKAPRRARRYTFN